MKANTLIVSFMAFIAISHSLVTAIPMPMMKGNNAGHGKPPLSSMTLVESSFGSYNNVFDLEMAADTVYTLK